MQTVQQKLEHDMSAEDGVQDFDLLKIPMDLSDYIRNCVTIGGVAPLRNQIKMSKANPKTKTKKPFECPGTKINGKDTRSKTKAELHLDEILAKAEIEWEIREKKMSNKEKYSYARAKDIIPDKHSKDDKEKRLSSFRSGTPILKDNRKWPGNNIYYCIKPGGNVNERRVRLGLRVALRGTYITYKKIDCDDDRHKIRFKGLVLSEDERAEERRTDMYTIGSSSVGYKGRKNQNLELRFIGEPANMDANYRTVAHEIIHALGFSHTHQRQDRGNYIHVEGPPPRGEPNTQTEANYYSWKANCASDNPDVFEDMGEDYDFGSIMHYEEGVCGIRKRDYLPAQFQVHLLNPTSDLGMANIPSGHDTALINEAYPAPSWFERMFGYGAGASVEGADHADRPDSEMPRIDRDLPRGERPR